MGVFAADEQPEYLGRRGGCCAGGRSPPATTSSSGISEMNLFLLLHASSGSATSCTASTLLPIGTVYDPFVCRGLDAFIYGTLQRRPLRRRRDAVGRHAGARRAAPTSRRSRRRSASSCPGVTFAEPAYATALDWLLCDGLAPARRSPTATRSTSGSRPARSTRRPSRPPAPASATSVLRADVLAGGYRLRRAGGDLRAGPAGRRRAGRQRRRAARGGGRRRAPGRRGRARRPCST